MSIFFKTSCTAFIAPFDCSVEDLREVIVVLKYVVVRWLLKLMKGLVSHRELLHSFPGGLVADNSVALANHHQRGSLLDVRNIICKHLRADLVDFEKIVRVHLIALHDGILEP